MPKVKKTGKQREECPNCGSIWGVGSEEWEWQQCDACGWPDADDDFEEQGEEDWLTEEDFAEHKQSLRTGYR